jgi:hypothetical protein
MSTHATGTGNGSPQGDPNVVVIREKRGWFGPTLVIFGVLGTLFAVYLGLAAVNILPSFLKNPFERQVTEHTGPALLVSITDNSEFLAAKGSFQVVVDYEEGRRLIPSWVSGCKALFVGYGDVDASVDVSGLTEENIQISADGTEVTITLPEPQLSDVDSDVRESYKFSEDRGLLERFTGMFTDSSECVPTEHLFQLAEDKIAQAARESDLIDRAKQNTEIWLEGLVRGFGFERVTVTFAPNPA